jgi:heptosyltransferase-3
LKKCWPAERFAKLLVEVSCNQGVTPLVFFGPADESVREAFEAAVPPGVMWECAAERTQREVLALLSQCRVFVGNDSGLSHLAARACPVVTLFGPTDPRRWTPLGPRVRVLEAPGGKMDSMSVDTVAETVRKILNFEF